MKIATEVVLENRNWLIGTGNEWNLWFLRFHIFLFVAASVGVGCLDVLLLFFPTGGDDDDEEGTYIAASCQRSFHHMLFSLSHHYHHHLLSPLSWSSKCAFHDDECVSTCLLLMERGRGTTLLFRRIFFSSLPFIHHHSLTSWLKGNHRREERKWKSKNRKEGSERMQEKQSKSDNAFTSFHSFLKITFWLSVSYCVL